MTTALAPTDTSAVSAEMVAFLAQLAVGLHKIRAYPPGHPMRRAAVESAFRALGGIVVDGPCRLGVSRTQLVVAGGTTDPDHFVLRDLAARLHRAQVGSVTFDTGVTEAEFTTLLEQLAAESAGARADAGGLGIQGTEHIQVAPIAFDALSLADGEPVTSEVDRHWQALAEVVGQSGGASASADFVQAMAERLASAEGRQAVAAAVERLGRWAQSGDGDVRVATETRLRDLLATIPPEALQRLLGVDAGRRDSLRKLLPAVDWLPTMALIDVVETAAITKTEGISSVLLRLLTKLARNNGTDGRSPASRELRGLVRSLLDSWTLEDPNTRANLALLEALSRRDPAAPTRTTEGDEPFRIVKMAVELGVGGDHVDEAVEHLVATGNTDDLVALAATDPVIAPDLLAMVAVPSLCRRVLADRRVALASIEAVVRRVGSDQGGFLVERLLVSDWPEVKALLCDALLSERFGRGAELLRRINSGTPDEQRGLLDILAETGKAPAGLVLGPHLGSVDPAIRLAAFRLGLGGPERDQLLPQALGDVDERVVRLAISHGLERFPRQALARLMSLLNSPRRSETVRAQAVAILAQFDEPTIREWLLSGLVVQGGWLRRDRLAPASPIVLAKLAVLAARWAGGPEVDKVLALARRAGDPAVLAAVQTPVGGP